MVMMIKLLLRSVSTIQLVPRHSFRCLPVRQWYRRSRQARSLSEHQYIQWNGYLSTFAARTIFSYRKMTVISALDSLLRINEGFQSHQFEAKSPFWFLPIPLLYTPF
jgi:hypothetical protein